jgi:phospholipase C
MRRPALLALSVTAALAVVTAACASSDREPGPPEAAAIRAEPLTDIHRIRHVVVIMQENRSFDSYFGTFPGADGIPMSNGRPTVCIPDPVLGHCVRPFHDGRERDLGGPHQVSAALADVDRGRMDGFIREQLKGIYRDCAGNPLDPNCTAFQDQRGRPNVMGYHDARDIPNYWRYAKDFVLQDHMFEPVFSWSLPAHLWMVSGWSAECSGVSDPMGCRTELSHPGVRLPGGRVVRRYPWTDLTYLLDRAGVSWGYYLVKGAEPDCENDGMLCPRVPQHERTPSIWNPLPAFNTVREDLDQHRITGSRGSWPRPTGVRSRRCPGWYRASGSASTPRPRSAPDRPT